MYILLMEITGEFLFYRVIMATRIGNRFRAVTDTGEEAIGEIISIPRLQRKTVTNRK